MGGKGFKRGIRHGLLAIDAKSTERRVPLSLFPLQPLRQASRLALLQISGAAASSHILRRKTNRL